MATSSAVPEPTRRLRFGLWDPDDIELAATLWCDRDVMRFLGGPYSATQVQERLAREISTQESSGVQYWPIFLVDGGAHVGCCGLKPAPEREQQTNPAPIFELGFHLRPDYWNAGLASEAAASAIAFAFDTLEANALFAGHHPENSASRALLERLLFKQIGTHFYEPTGLDPPWYRRNGV